MNVPEPDPPPIDELDGMFLELAVAVASLLSGTGPLRQAVGDVRKAIDGNVGLPVSAVALADAVDEFLGPEGDAEEMTRLAAVLAPLAVWTVIGVWEGSDPVPVGVIAGQHDVKGGDEEAFPDGLWAEQVTGADPAEAEAAAVRLMLAQNGPGHGGGEDDECDGAPEMLPVWRFNDHKNPNGVWCRSSRLPISGEVAATGDGRCLHDCPDSVVERIPYRFTRHANDQGDLCQWSGTWIKTAVVRPYQGMSCPAACQDSDVEEVPHGQQ